MSTYPSKLVGCMLIGVSLTGVGCSDADDSSVGTIRSTKKPIAYADSDPQDDADGGGPIVGPAPTTAPPSAVSPPSLPPSDKPSKPAPSPTPGNNVAGLAKLLTLPVTIVERVLGQVVKAATLPIDAVSQLVETLLSLVGDVSGNLGEIVGILGALPGNVILELLNILPISGEALTNILNALPNNPLAGAAGMNQSFDAAGYLKNATPGTTCKVAVEQVGARRRCAAPKNFVSCTTLEDCQAKCLVCQ